MILSSITVKDEMFRSLDTIFNAEIAINQSERGWLSGEVSYNLYNSDYIINTSIETWQLAPLKTYVTSSNSFE